MNTQSFVRWTAIRSPNNPLIHPATPGLPDPHDININGPSVIRVPAWVERPLGRYYMYFAHHSGASIRLAYADSLHGPWTIYPGGALHLEQTAAVDHIASPDVHIDDATRSIRMYFHGLHPDESRQVSFVATSADGLHFHARPERLGWFYFRVFTYGRWHYALAKYANDSGVMQRSPDGFAPFEEGPQIVPRMRHAAVLLEGDRLLVFHSRIGDEPERILVSTIDLRNDWRTWSASEPETVLAPELPYEGADLPLRPSRAGAIWEPARELRDPAVLVEDGRVFLFYAVAGERGIALAELQRG